MSNEHKPLLSERQLIDKFRVKPDEAPDGYAHGIAAVNTAIYVRDIYEAERAKDRELMQMLVSNIHSRVMLWSDPEFREALYADEIKLLELAAERGITPTDQ